MRRVALIILLIASAVAGPAAADDLPAPDEVLDRWVEAMGGRARLERVRAVRMVGVIEIQGAGADAVTTGAITTGAIKVEQAVPARQHITLALPGQPERAWTTDGESAWQRVGDAVEVLEGDARADRIRRAIIFPFLDWKQRYAGVSVVAVDEVAGRPCHALEFETFDCRTIAVWFDVETGRQVRVSDNVIDPGGRYRARTDVEAWREVDGVWFPRRLRREIRTENAASVQRYRFEEITVNHQLDGRTFEAPPETVRALAEEQAGQAGLPKAEVIIDRHLDAVGGVETMQAVRTRLSIGTFRQNNGGAQRITIVQAAPRRQHVALGGAKYVANGEFAWVERGGSLEVAGGIQAAQSIRRASLHTLLNWRDDFRQVETIRRDRLSVPISAVTTPDGALADDAAGDTDVAERDVWVVRLTTHECQTEDASFDVETGRLLRVEGDVAYGAQRYRMDSRIEAYRTHDGVLVPVRTRRILQGPGGRQVQYYVIESVQHNVDAPDELFATPPELVRSPVPRG